ncbi:cell wall hydrolase [Pseudomonas lactucae]|uniref:cell wall hydrolase n=1 Tax=Pseudomonas lactucae TaxID=2813360 RepID=UPI002FCCF7FF
MAMQNALLCLALNIYHEARGEPEEGQIAVALVTMNRAEWRVENVCQTVYKPWQFSWTRSASTLPRHEKHAWIKAKTMAQEIIEGYHPDITQGSTHFHAQHIRPAWHRSFVKTVHIGNHIFYTQSANTRVAPK